MRKKHPFADSQLSVGWESVVYTFEPYMSKEKIEHVIGFKSNLIQETVSEGMVQLLFIKGSFAVASVCGYGGNLDIALTFPVL